MAEVEIKPTPELEIKPTPRMRLRVFALVCIGVGLSSLEMFLLAGGGANFFAARTTLTTYMQDAEGLTTDSEVRLNGLHIGEVRKIELSGALDPRQVVRVEMRVLTRYLKSIPADSQIDVNADTIVAEKFVEVAEGQSPIPIGENGVLQSKSAVEATDRTAVIESLQASLKQVDQILAQMQSPQTEIGRFVLGEEVYDSGLALVSGFDSSLHTFLNPRSELGQAVYSLKMYNRIHDFVVSLDQTLASIQNGEGATGRLFASDEQYNQFVRQLTDLRASLAAAGANPMLRDDAEYRRIVRLLSDIDATMASLNAGEGSFGRLLTNAQLYESLNGSLRSMEALVRDFQRNPQKYLRVRHKIF